MYRIATVRGELGGYMPMVLPVWFIGRGMTELQISRLITLLGYWPDEENQQYG